MPRELAERREWIKKNLRPTRGHIRTVRPPRIHPGNTVAAYLKELHEKADVEESWIVCMLFPTDAVRLFFHSKYESKAVAAMQKLDGVSIFGRKVEAVFGADKEFL